MLEPVAAEIRFNGIFATEGADGASSRRTVTAALNHTKFKGLFPALAVTVGHLERHWERAADASQPVDLCRDRMRFTVYAR